ncbi:hypothetical protein ACQ4M3_34335 [Leptolyngbya sp. AN03gr2]|uniref:hypothetical protein n=1 Tax=unclassified Leptolyngbya TaxID=2650499 RepID=UPI003D31CD18
MPKLKLTIEAINARLKAAKVGVSVLPRGDRLYLQATLPPKPGKKKTQPYQQQISLKIYASQDGLAQAEAKALELGALIAREKFDWKTYEGLEDEPVATETCGNWVERYRLHLMQTVIDEATPEIAHSVWKQRFWNPALKWLPVDGPLNEATILTAVQHYRQNTRSRQLICQVLQAFAAWCGLNIDLSSYSGNYSVKDAVRVIPPDLEIAKAIEKIKHPGWRWIYGMMAAYGLRDHECWFTELEWVEDPELGLILVANVRDGKTGEHQAMPFYPEWVHEWKLWEVCKPQLKVKLHKDYGDRTSKAFKRAGVGFTPYSLRHAYAIRGGVVFRMPIPVMAAMMGHSPEVHLKTYQRWISKEQHQQSYLSAIRYENRPKPPIVAASST